MNDGKNGRSVLEPSFFGRLPRGMVAEDVCGVFFVNLSNEHTDKDRMNFIERSRVKEVREMLSTADLLVRAIGNFDASKYKFFSTLINGEDGKVWLEGIIKGYDDFAKIVSVFPPRQKKLVIGALHRAELDFKRDLAPARDPAPAPAA